MNIGIGPTDELSLRVSVAALVRVLFEPPDSGEIMLALERRATLQKSRAERVEIKSQPFGGALCIYDLNAFQNRLGRFHFDSDRSRIEQDFRIFIQPSAWETVREFCLEHFHQPTDSVESDPTRELTEEFMDTLGMSLKSDQYSYRAVGTVLENDPSPTGNLASRGHPTVRIYRIFEARIVDPFLADSMLRYSRNYSDQDLYELALDRSRRGEPGRANAILTLPYKELNAFYRSIPLEARNQPIVFQNHRLDETVAAVVEDVTVPKYQRL